MKKIFLTAILACITMLPAKQVGRYDLSSKLAPGGNYRTFSITVKQTRIGGVNWCAYAGRIVARPDRDGTCPTVTLHHLSRVRPSMGERDWNGFYCGYDYTTDGPLLKTNNLRTDCPDILVMNKNRVVDTLFYGENDNIADYYDNGVDPIYPEFFYNPSVFKKFPRYKKQIEYYGTTGILVSTQP